MLTQSSNIAELELKINALQSNFDAANRTISSQNEVVYKTFLYAFCNSKCLQQISSLTKELTEVRDSSLENEVTYFRKYAFSCYSSYMSSIAMVAICCCHGSHMLLL